MDKFSRHFLAKLQGSALRIKTMNITAEETKTVIEELTNDTKDMEYQVGQNAQLTLILIAKVSVEANVSVRLTGSRARADIYGFINGYDEQVTKLHTLQHHEAPGTVSNLLVKSVLHNSSRFYYDGAIVVDKNAQKTDAYQRNENLLVSLLAKAESKPALEILANDVRCTHGATVAPISEEQRWYLESRGISKQNATALIIDGFMESAILKIPDTIAQENVRRILWRIS